jgi:hypothetical protein
MVWRPVKGHGVESGFRAAHGVARRRAVQQCHALRGSPDPYLARRMVGVMKGERSSWAVENTS